VRATSRAKMMMVEAGINIKMSTRGITRVRKSKSQKLLFVIPTESILSLVSINKIEL
jgi:hypothetical protein